MANFDKITEALYANKGVTGLPDTPGLSAGEMQKKFDELSIDVLIPFINELIDKLNDEDASASIGAKPTQNMLSTTSKLQDILEELDNMAHTAFAGGTIEIDATTGHLIVHYPDGTTGDMGTIAFAPKGAFDASVQYDKFNLVLYTDGNTYVAISRPPVGTLPTDTTYWMLFVDSATAYSSFDTRIGDIEDTIESQNTMISATLSAGDTSVELVSSKITTDSIIDPYFNADGTTEPICYKTILIENGKVTMTFDEMESDITVGITVR